MVFTNQILIQALKWRVKYLNKKYVMPFTDTQGIGQLLTDDEMLVAVQEHKIYIDKIMSEIYRCQNFITDLEKEDFKHSNEIITGVLFCSFIGLSMYFLLWFANINGVV